MFYLPIDLRNENTESDVVASILTMGDQRYMNDERSIIGGLRDLILKET